MVTSPRQLEKTPEQGAAQDLSATPVPRGALRPWHRVYGKRLLAAKGYPPQNDHTVVPVVDVHQLSAKPASQGPPHGPWITLDRLNVPGNDEVFSRSITPSLAV